MSKSESIRQHLKVAKDKSPKAISEALKEKGVNVTPNLVSLIKYQSEKGKAKSRSRSSKRRNGKVKVAEILAAARTRPDPVDAAVVHLINAKEFIGKVGGVKQAYALLDAVNKFIAS